MGNHSLGSRERAWAYLSCPLWYEHAEGQWRRRIERLGQRDGFEVERWWVDHGDTTIDAVVMLHHMPQARVDILVLPYPTALECVRQYKGARVGQIEESLGLRVIILDRVMTIPPKLAPDLGIPPPVRRRRGLRARLRLRGAS